MNEFQAMLHKKLKTLKNMCLLQHNLSMYCHPNSPNHIVYLEQC